MLRRGARVIIGMLVICLGVREMILDERIKSA